MIARTLLILATAALPLTGCATGHSMPASAVPPAAAPDSGFALVYVIRDNAQPTAWSATVRVDGLRVAGLAQKSYTRVYVAAGDHRVGVSWNRLSGQLTYSSPFRAVSGRTYYMMVRGVSRWESSTITLESGLIPVYPREAEAAIARCQTFAPLEITNFPASPVPAYEL